jgi:hypothetical protein
MSIKKLECFAVIKNLDAPGRGRTYGLLLRKQTLYPLSYRRLDDSK